ncbi:LysR family transcriptional regulator [Flexivirga sp. ID2601S]|uniref:LysR family transcriptional regulator n=1 Tax=Flexivirga aerilata TaxID=1656889 RepID=A0A849AI70_9MICO|nr:LysR family transcriptional regulator [Flexivirga aerilata]NNG39547.1 LysR family transcriptional regulator [Flexivirga aerilata]
MDSLPEVDDLRLVVAVARTGSVGSAARSLRVTQPSASARLARLERRVGATLFDRDTTGARPTPAGAELVRQARHILGHLEGAFAASRAATRERRLVVGTFASLTSLLFPALDALLPEVAIDQRQDHGPVLLQWVAEGSMDAAFVAVADQVEVPSSVVTHQVGTDPLVLFRAVGVEPIGRGRLPLRDRQVVASTYDLSTEEVLERLHRLGADARPGVTLAAAIAMARKRGHLAVLPRSAVAFDLREGEVVERLPFRRSMRLVMAAPRTADPRLLGILRGLRRELDLAR